MTSIQNIAPQPSFTDHAKNDMIQTAREVAAQHQSNQVDTTHSRQIASDTSSTSSTPTTGAREVVLSPYEQQKKMVEERLADNTDYQEAKGLAAQESQVMQDFQLVEANTLWPGDDVVTLADLKAVAGDLNRPEYVRDAANRLLRNTAVWNGAKKDDQIVSSADLTAFFHQKRADMSAIKAAVTAEVKDELKANAPSNNGGSGTPGVSPPASSTQNAATNKPSPEDSVPKPPQSTKQGIEGSGENLANTADYLQKQMMALAEDAAAHPENATVNAQKIAMLQNKFQAITNMQSQMTQMLSNMSKMWSDVAMNSIRNLK